MLYTLVLLLNDVVCAQHYFDPPRKQEKTITPSRFKLLSLLTFCVMFDHLSYSKY
jgi:hypothetical protein